ncbi:MULTISPECIES: MerR family transcriptional regulator [Rhizobium]|uniref:HTH-type transcriptional regulator cueR Copper efflux regulator n=1 Tax=Rhizobium favelukesii TaxID=348824 RepID=W6RE85_9HYPH|nr:MULTISPECIES: MerR family transcriptional regulator [Rhizobium]MCA0802657.1 MerR family transcriptional regulator [Rhizobium sp. T1473]MCS0457538.1 MerR family transcriptional regulator [Rhizobium favelukesii]UFS83760.1 MerR family transcriptional regulator [Rhizobium sp. T136]CDM58620.1 HTH-type transcriptional regulator cueR Copper efflux regulator [Rhizobium favelukesii]
MDHSAHFLSPSEAAARLGISIKALRIYEQRGLVDPLRTSSGWRAYGPDEMARAGEIVGFRALGLSLTQIAQVLKGDRGGLEHGLALHQASLENGVQRLIETIGRVATFRRAIAAGHAPSPAQLASIMPTSPVLAVFELPWPWGGERFELRDVKALNYIIGPLGSGKTRLAHAIADALPDARFLGLDRAAATSADIDARLDIDPASKARFLQALDWLIDEGATASLALIALLAELEGQHQGMLIIDMIEQGLDQATQEALISYLRNRPATARTLFMLTRSKMILDLSAVTPNEAIIFCPANHNPPMTVHPYPGAPGYEAVATCLASPDVRARTEGVIAWRPAVA